MKKTFLTILMLALAVLSCGCTGSSQDVVVNNPTQTPIPDPTFASPSRQTDHPSPVTGLATTPQLPDPIIGSWSLVNGSYDCSAVFVAGGDGHIRCEKYGIPLQKNLAWSNHQEYYWISLSDGSGSTQFTNITDGKLTSDILPDGSYMVKLT